MIAALGLVLGIALGLVIQPDVPFWLEPYLPIAVVAALDAVFGAFRAFLDGIFDDKVFVISFISNVLIAAMIVYLGDKLGVGGQLLGFFDAGSGRGTLPDRGGGAPLRGRGGASVRCRSTCGRPAARSRR